MTAFLTSDVDPDVSELVGVASGAATVWSATSVQRRRATLEAIADALDAHADELVALAVDETHLTEGRLRGELKRTTFQLRLFGEVVAEGAFLDARIDHADPNWGMGPRPDLRRMLEPLGPVVVFAASNFPFAFSVAGGDTASALAAGCPVIVKAHFGHPALSARTGAIVQQALSSQGTPEGLFALIYGEDAGRLALTDSRIKAGSFTGSVSGGRALLDLANARPEPIPFFGEMGSVNPVFVTTAAAESRGQQIATGLIDSFTLGAGQFCTKPGVVFVPQESTVLAQLACGTLPPVAPLLNDRIQDGYTAALGRLAEHPGVDVLAQGSDTFGAPPTPTVLTCTLETVLGAPNVLLAECFGPTVLLVRYQVENDLLTAAQAIEGQLTATIVAEETDQILPDLMPLLATKAGRLLWNQWPTGVSVTYAQQHGGPYPATTAAASTSVGTGAISRFLRPVAYQGFPAGLLPAALDDENSLGIPRRVDGRLVGSDAGLGGLTP